MFMIIDGSGIINTQYYGQLKLNPMMRMAASDASISFIRKLVQLYNPSYLAVVLDDGRENTFRKELYPEYKAQRIETPIELKTESQIFREKLDAMHIRRLSHPKYEADDFAASIVNTFSTEKFVLISKDQDYLQLISSRTYLWLYKTEEQIDKLANALGPKYRVNKKLYCFTTELCKENYGLYPWQIPDLKALNGDVSDNIPGVKGLGTAAVPLLKRYGAIEDMYLELEYVPEKTVKDAWKKYLKVNRSKYDLLIKQKSNAFLSKNLATMKKDLPVPNKLEYYTIPNTIFV